MDRALESLKALYAELDAVPFEPGLTEKQKSLFRHHGHKNDPMPWLYSDGGRTEAGYLDPVGDCVTRAIALARRLDYATVYEALDAFIIDRTRPKNPSRANRGISTGTLHAFIHYAFRWPFTNCKAGRNRPTTLQLNAESMPAGNLVVIVRGHAIAVVDRVALDTHMESSGGKRDVWGYWTVG